MKRKKVLKNAILSVKNIFSKDYLVKKQPAKVWNYTCGICDAPGCNQ